jgi:hypothetical protein
VRDHRNSSANLKYKDGEPARCGARKKGISSESDEGKKKGRRENGV